MGLVFLTCAVDEDNAFINAFNGCGHAGLRNESQGFVFGVILTYHAYADNGAGHAFVCNVAIVGVRAESEVKPGGIFIFLANRNIYLGCGILKDFLELFVFGVVGYILVVFGQERGDFGVDTHAPVENELCHDKQPFSR